MNLYVKHFVNVATGKIEHSVSSDAPITPEVTIKAVTGNLQPDPVYREVEEELETTDFIRAGDLMKLRKFNKTTQKIVADATADATLKARLIKVRAVQKAVA